MIFPPEIIDYIFSFLQSDPAILARCSRAHPLLSPYAERLYYSNITLLDVGLVDEDSQRFPAAVLHKLLTDSPHIANYIRKLEIRLAWLGYLMEGHERAAEITSILPMLHQLRSISISSEIYGRWPDLSAGFRDAFAHRLLSSKSVLKEVVINMFYDFPLHVLDSCKTVKTISLHRSAKYSVDDFQVVPHLALDSLSLSDMRHTESVDSTFLTWARKNIPCLHSLSIRLDSLRTLPELIGMCSNSLQSLDLYFSGRLFCTDFYADGARVSPTENQYPNISSATHLDNLTVGTRMDIDNTKPYRYSCTFPMITELLKTAPNVKNLTLKFYIVCFSSSSEDPAFKLIHWSSFILFLSHSSIKFQHISIHFSLQLLLGGRFVVASADTLPQVYRSEIILDMMAKGILDISSEEWTAPYLYQSTL